MISVIIPAYNDEECLKKGLTSVFNSDYKDFEVIVVNDASKDNSLDVAKSFPCRIVDLKINKGIANARNQGADAAKGDILVFFDSDIVIEEDNIWRLSDKEIDEEKLLLKNLNSIFNKITYENYDIIWKVSSITLELPNLEVIL